MGGETALIVNRELNKIMNKAYTAVTEMLAAEILPTFEEFRQKMEADKKIARSFADMALELLKNEYDAKEISYRTLNVYRAAVKKFKEVEGDVRLHEINQEKVLSFKRKMIAAGKENLANQYVRYLKIIYARVLKFCDLKDARKPFEKVDIKIVKISEKKSLTTDEYFILQNALKKASPGSKEHETLRRFLMMCRGLRFSDTQHIKKDTHYVEYQEDGIWYRYLTTHAQKTGSKEIVPISENDAALLLHWRPDGYLFPKVNYQTYCNWLRRISQQLLGREITTHYGRHFTGDFILNSGDMSIEDVKTILGVKSDRIAEIYAQKDIKSVLKKFYKAVEGLEGG